MNFLIFCISFDTPDTGRIYNETNAGLHSLNTTSHPWQVMFLLNNTWLLVTLQNTSVIKIYSVDFITNKFQYNQSVPILHPVVWTLTKNS
jgi:hypothetical protein